jgi:hypothetical protein
MKFTKELAVNIGLSFVAGFVTTFGVFVAATPRPASFAVVAAAAGAAAWAGFRAVVGFLALNAPKVPAIPVDE